MAVTDMIVIAVVFGILIGCLVFDRWVRGHEYRAEEAARRRVLRELARREQEVEP